MVKTVFDKIINKISNINVVEFNEILDNGCLHRLMSIEKLNDDYISDLAREKLEKQHDFSYIDVFKTRKAREVYSQIISKIKSKMTTHYARLLLGTFAPVSKKEEILRRQMICEKALQLKDNIIDRNESKNIIKSITSIELKSTKRYMNVAIAIADDEIYKNLKNKLSEKFFVLFVDEERDMENIAHYDQIRFIPGHNQVLNLFAEEFSQVIVIRNMKSFNDVAPEFTTDVIEHSYDNIIQFKQLEDMNLISGIPNIPSCEFFSDISMDEIDVKIEDMRLKFEIAITREVQKANFTGDVIMGILERNDSIIDALNEEAIIRISNIQKRISERLYNIFKIHQVQLMVISNRGKVSIDEERYEKLKIDLIASAEEDKFKRLLKIAKEAKELIEKLPHMIEQTYYIDMLLGISDFIDEFKLTKPSLGKFGLKMSNGSNLNVKNAQSVSYRIGGDDKVAVVTGANSGGKTTLMELLLQVQILTQMGLFVPCEKASVDIVEELYYFSKSKGSMGAGAFETMLKQFSKITESSAKKFILADEIESVTEPDAAVRIIRGIIEHIGAEKENTLLFVSHIGKELQATGVKVRFDGIEAKGLDDDLNLIVERNPVIGRIARSTPQLIIERLAKKNDNEFYAKLLSMVV